MKRKLTENCVTYIARWIFSVFSCRRRRSHCVCFARVFLTDKIMIHMFLSVSCTRIIISQKVISRTSRQTFQPFFVSLGFCGRSECKRDLNGTWTALNLSQGFGCSGEFEPVSEFSFCTNSCQLQMWFSFVQTANELITVFITDRLLTDRVRNNASH